MRTDETNNGHSAGTAPPVGPEVATPPLSSPAQRRRRRRRGPDRRSADGAVSDRRAAANRANAQRSTGPRTERGKKIARLNALQHGMAAQTSLLPGEDDVALAALTAEFEADHGCGSAAERAVAGRMVSVVWKLRRLARAEEHAADELQTKHAYAWGTRRARLGIPLPADGYGFDGPDPMPLPTDAPQIVAEELGREVKPGAIERLMIWDVRLGGELMAASRQLANLRRALGTAHEEPGRDEPLVPRERVARDATAVAEDDGSVERWRFGDASDGEGDADGCEEEDWDDDEDVDAEEDEDRDGDDDDDDPDSVAGVNDPDGVARARAHGRACGPDADADAEVEHGHEYMSVPPESGASEVAEGKKGVGEKKGTVVDEGRQPAEDARVVGPRRSDVSPVGVAVSGTGEVCSDIVSREPAHLPSRPLTLALLPEYRGEATGGGVAVGGGIEPATPVASVDAAAASPAAAETSAVPDRTQYSPPTEPRRGQYDGRRFRPQPW